MKRLRCLFCLLLTLAMLGALLSSCAGGETPAQTTGQQETTLGNTTATDTTAPPVTTLPQGNETTVPVTDPPKTEAPCSSHVFAPGSLCTEERSCTVCGHRLAALPDHIFGAAAACGTQKCENCSVAIFGRYCGATLTAACDRCGLDTPPAIPFITVGGVAISEFSLVIPTPEQDMEQDYEYYVSEVLANRVKTYHGKTLRVVTDSVEKSGPEIRVGLTDRTVSQSPAEGQLLIRVVGEDLEILCNGLYAYSALLDWVTLTFSSQKSEGIVFTDGVIVSEQYETSAKDTKIGDLRVMYHNMLGFIDGKDSKSRFSFYRALYDHYRPDVLGMQEAAANWKGKGFFDKNNNRNLRNYMLANGYKLIHNDTNLGMFYREDTLTLIEKGSVNVRGNYGSTWAIFLHKESNTYFGIVNSHFAVDSDQDRIKDAQTVTGAISSIKTAATAKNIDGNSLPIIAGGDYNCRVDSSPLGVLDGAGLVHARAAVKDSAMVDDVATNGNDVSYHDGSRYHTFTTEVKGKGDDAIDHCYLYNDHMVTAHQYRVVTHPLSGGCSDHHAHYLDFSFGTAN